MTRKYNVTLKALSMVLCTKTTALRWVSWESYSILKLYESLDMSLLHCIFCTHAQQRFNRLQEMYCQFRIQFKPYCNSYCMLYTVQWKITATYFVGCKVSIEGNKGLQWWSSITIRHRKESFVNSAEENKFKLSGCWGNYFYWLYNK